MSSNLHTLLAGKSTVSGAGSRRASARPVLEGAWEVIWRSLGGQVPDVMTEALGALSREEDAADARLAKSLLVRDREIAQNLQAALRAELNASVEDFISRRHQEAEKQTATKPTLSLIGYGEMELSTVVEAASARIRNSVDDTYSNLKLRLANLVKENEVRETECPFRPAVFYRAFHVALEKLGIVTGQDLLKLMPRFDGALIRPMAQVYTDLDTYLGGKGLKAEVAIPTSWRNTLSSTRSARNTQMGGSTQTGGVTTQLAGSSGQFNAEQILQALYGRINLSGAVAPGGMPGMSAGGGDLGPMTVPGYITVPGGMTLPGPMTIPGPMTLPGPMGMPAPVGGAWPNLPSGGASSAVMINTDLLSAINEIQKLGAMALAAMQQGAPAPDAAIDVGKLRGKLVERATEQVDKLTIEIVGMLFERINADRHVPQEIKELLQRLQFPLIKVALTDPELFVSPQQAARQLMDRIASTSIGWTSEGEDNQRYISEVQKAIHRVLSAPEAEGLTAFEVALQDFEKYLDDERTRDDDPVTRAKRALAEAESREVMAINATIKIRSAFDGVSVESYLREFLLETWVRVMVAATLRDKSNPEAMRRYLVIVPDLVWSVQPKINPEDRKRLVSTIPPVLTVLREGMQLISYPKEKTQDFFAKLMISHAQAVKALELAHGHVSAVAPFDPNTMRIKLDGIDLTAEANLESDEQGSAPIVVSDEVVRQVLAANHAPVQHHPMPEPLADAEQREGRLDLASDDEIDTRIDGWRRGDWFNLRVGNVIERVRLRWVSPRRTLYLFTPADGKQAHSLAPASLRAYVRNGDLQPVETVPLFDRAVYSVVNDLQDAAAVQPQALS